VGPYLKSGGVVGHKISADGVTETHITGLRVSSLKSFI